MNPAKTVFALFAILFLGSMVVTTTAEPAPRYVTAVKAKIKIRKASCPGTARMKITVWSREAGRVKVTLIEGGKGNLGTDVIVATKRTKSGLYKGIQTGKVQLTRTGRKTRYRVVAGDGGRAASSRWISIRACELVT